MYDKARSRSTLKITDTQCPLFQQCSIGTSEYMRALSQKQSQFQILNKKGTSTNYCKSLEHHPWRLTQRPLFLPTFKKTTIMKILGVKSTIAKIRYYYIQSRRD